MKHVVILGDSIRLSYWERVAELLSDIAVVHSPDGENCAYTLHTIRRVRDWFKEWGLNKADLIHWNNGAWDHHRNAQDNEPFSSLEQYVSLQKRLFGQLSRYSDKLIFATTTPGGPMYDPDSHILLTLDRDGWNKEVSLYNDVLSAYLKNQGVRINDIYGLVYPRADEYIGEDGLHLSPAGVEAVAQKVAKEIRAMLAE